MGRIKWNSPKAKGLFKINKEKKPDHPRAEGWVSGEEFLCVCGSVTKNTPRDIGNHHSKMHRKNSAYYKHQMSAKGNKTWKCPECGTKHGNFHAFLTHCRRTHGFRGKSAPKEDKLDPYKPESCVEQEFQRAVASGETEAMIAQRAQKR
ncbi:hypothetical protein GGS26DRAFT_595849 [Hypomontagnella submonticulosa]|nr:hypothetical protein GGS26DRAFT_595849 [Hypomontagnella submonticulosa]